MFCENCGEKVSEDDSFCTNCGNPIKKEDSKEVTAEEKVSEETKTEENAEIVNIEEIKTEQSKVEENPTVKAENTIIQKENIQKGASGKVILIILAILIALAGIGTALYFFVFKNKDVNSIETLQKAVENMENLKSFTMVISGDVSTEGEEGFDASFNWETSFDVENKKAQTNIKASYSGVEVEIPAYIDFSDKNNGLVYFKLPAMLTGVDEWTKVSLGEVDFDELIGGTVNSGDDDADYESKIEELKEKVKEVEFVKKGKSDIDDCDYYEIIINEDNIKKLSEIYEDFDITDSDISEMQLKDGFVIGVYVNKKENYISKIKLDMTDYINQLEDNEITFGKLIINIEYKDINKVSEINIPEEAKNAEEIDLEDLYSNFIPSDNNVDVSIDDDEEDEYVEDYTITDYGFKVKYNMPTGFESSSVNSADFKIYRNENLRVIISNYWDTKDERFDDIESDKEYYENDEDYKSVVLSEEKKITVKDKEFVYKELSYESSYGTKEYQVTVCYQLDDDHVYRVEYEKSGSPLTEDEIKLFLDITISK